MKYLYLLLFAFIFYCENTSNYQEKENLRNTFILLNLPNEEKILELCIESEQNAITCASTSVTSYISLLNGFYNISITSTNPESYCPSLLNSQILKDFTYDAKRCHLECNKRFWQSANCSDFSSTLSKYSKCLPGIWITQCEDQNFKNCLRNCFLYGTPYWFIK
ncbi:MAG: hypothetical protein ACK4UJ_05575 [Leptonema sp. (in: bacteria)]